MTPGATWGHHRHAGSDGCSDGCNRLHAAQKLAIDRSSSADDRLAASGLRQLALLQVSPPDARGFVSLGVSVDLAPAVLSVARSVIAEVNPAMPRTHGESFVDLKRFDALVKVDVPVTEYLHAQTGEIAERVARYIASIIDDGSTLQIGLGRVPNEALRHLRDRRDLGIHSDVITDGVVSRATAAKLSVVLKQLPRDFIHHQCRIEIGAAEPSATADISRLAIVQGMATGIAYVWE